MTEQSRVMAGALVGACLGALGSYLFFTDRGRALRDNLEPAVRNLRQDFARVRQALVDAGEVAWEGLQIVQDFRSRSPQGRAH